MEGYNFVSKVDDSSISIVTREREGNVDAFVIDTHYGTYVEPGSRGKGIGHILRDTKEACDGVLGREYSHQIDLFCFLLSRGYCPFAVVESSSYIDYQKREFMEKDWLYIVGLMKKVPVEQWGNCEFPYTVEFLYAPEEAKGLMDRLK